MQIAFYKNKSANNVVNKTIGNPVRTISGIIIKEHNSLKTANPSLLLQIDGDWTDIVDFNYCRIYQTDRDYYVTNHTAEGGLLRLDLECDVLMSFKKDIYSDSQREQLIERQQTKMPESSKLIADEQLPMKSTHYYQSKLFGIPVSDFESQRIIVETVGRGGRIV